MALKDIKVNTDNRVNQTSQISLNNDAFSLSVRIVRDVEDLPNSDKNSVNQILDNDKVKEYSFTSDLVFPITIGSLVYTDIGSYLFSKISADGRTYLFLSIEKIGNETNVVGISQSEQKYEEAFLITNIDMLDRKTEESTFRISFVSDEWYKLNNYFNFSSEGEKPVYQILQNLILAGGLKLKPNTEVKQVERNQFFITPTSYNLLDSIRYLLSIGIDPNNGFYFFIRNHIEANYELISLKQLYNNITIDEIPSRNIMILPSKFFYPTGNIGRQAVHELKEINVNGADTNTEMLKPYAFTTYDYVKREFNSINVNFNKLVGTLPDPQSTSFNNNLNPPPTEISNLNYFREKTPINTFDYYFSMTKLFMWTNVIEFKIYGDIERKAGEIMFINVPEGDEYNEKIGGYWYILRVKHMFDKKTYYNYIQACRIDRKIVETNKKLFSQST